MLLEWTRNVNFCTVCEIIFLVSCPWKSNVVLEKFLKSGCNFLYDRCIPIGGWVNWLGGGWVGLVKMREPPGFRSPGVGISVDSTDCPTIPISPGFSRFCLKILNSDQHAIRIGRIPILTSVLIFLNEFLW